MPALIDIVNSALATLGEQPLVDLSTNNATSIAVLVNSKLKTAKQAILIESDWNCARMTTKLTPLATSPLNGYAYTYPLPTEPKCLKIVQISVDGGITFFDLDAYYNGNAGPISSRFDLDEQNLLSDSDSVYIKYTADVDPAKFDAALTEAFAAYLASELAFAITNSSSLADSLRSIANRKLNKAKSRNAMNRNVYQPDGDATRVRGGSYNSIRVDMSEEAE